MTNGLIQAVSRAPRVSIEDVFQRHASAKHTALTGSLGGRWGGGAYPVLYLARPEQAVVAEAYRWLVDPTEGMTGDRVHDRVLLTVRVTAEGILDLRDRDVRGSVGLTDADIFSEVNDADAYARCRAVSQAAHQLGMKGLLVPAASQLGETLALFSRQLLPGELPELVTQVRWEVLPPDPRRLRLVSDDAADA